MLLSMTGFGNAVGQTDRFSTSVEIKTVNNRYLKISVRLPDVLARLEPDFERVIRKQVARGTVTVGVRFTPLGQTSRYQISSEVLSAYATQLGQAGTERDLPVPEWSDSLLLLPGVVSDELSSSIDCQTEWPSIQSVLDEALEQLKVFRQTEGESMWEELTSNCDAIEKCLDAIVERCPDVVSNYRDRILERVNELLRESGVSVEPDHLIREVSVFADRCDINEEITRLRCHIEQFREVMKDSQSQGRKLDFLSQEMFREVNTIGSKASDVGIAHQVVDMKSAVEKMREILQNVE